MKVLNDGKTIIFSGFQNYSPYELEGIIHGQIFIGIFTYSETINTYNIQTVEYFGYNDQLGYIYDCEYNEVSNSIYLCGSAEISISGDTIGFLAKFSAITMDSYGTGNTPNNSNIFDIFADSDNWVALGIIAIIGIGFVLMALIKKK